MNPLFIPTPQDEDLRLESSATKTADFAGTTKTRTGFAPGGIGQPAAAVVQVSAATRDGEVSAPVIVNASGAWADTVAGLADLGPLGIVPKRRTAIIVEPPIGQDSRRWPGVLDVRETWYIKPEAGKLMCSPGDETPTRALVWTLVVLALLLVAAFLFARYLARPLRELTTAVERVGRGEPASPLPEGGPSEIAAMNRGFNAMTANLARMEQDRALLLAGVSHDLRTPLARLRLGVEMSAPGSHVSLCIGPAKEPPARLHIAFVARTREQVDAFHRAALAAGGQDNGAPGLRPTYHPNYYAAFVIGPDGHNVEMVCHEPQA